MFKVTACLQCCLGSTASTSWDSAALQLQAANGEDGFLCAPCWQPCWIIPQSSKATSSTASSSSLFDKNDWRNPGTPSGHGNSVTMRLIHVVRLLTQVSNDTSLFGKKCDDVCLFLFPCPGVLFSLCCQCFDVLSQVLLMSGDVELNPGPKRTQDAAPSETNSPMTDAMQKQFNDMFVMLQGVNSRTVKMEKDQSSLISTVNDIKKSQELIESRITDIDKRLTAVESKSSSSDLLQRDLSLLRQRTDSLIDVNSRLRASQAELEDRSRRDNLLFYGLTDAHSETWAQTEEKLLNVVSTSLNFPISSESIERAHRLGVFSDNKCRPVIVKFLSFKLKQQILFSSAKLKPSGITVSEDYSVPTRQARRKLIEFAKTQNSVFKLKYNKLYMNNKTYSYNPVDDCVFEHVSTPNQRSLNRSSNTEGDASPASTSR
uniref:Putative tick transposon n=1 Tax=Ixodes scapularis TaxID=6945 RepID=A0A4D5RFB8_IXOSC